MTEIEQYFFGILEIEKLFSHIGRKTNVIPLPSLLILKFLVFWRFNSIYECVTHIGWIFFTCIYPFYEKIIWNTESENVHFKSIYWGGVMLLDFFKYESNQKFIFLNYRSFCKSHKDFHYQCTITRIIIRFWIKTIYVVNLNKQ